MLLDIKMKRLFKFKESLIMITQQEIESIIKINSRKMDFFKSTSEEILSLINKEIENYKKIMKLAEVPQYIIDNPEIVNQQKLAEEDLKWATEFLDKRNKK
jgi:hypothetical protein